MNKMKTSLAVFVLALAIPGTAAADPACTPDPWAIGGLSDCLPVLKRLGNGQYAPINSHSHLSSRPIECDDYMYVDGSGSGLGYGLDSGPQPDGEKDYHYGNLIQFEEDGTTGANVIRDLLTHPELDKAIRADQETRDNVLDDSRLKLAFKCDTNYKKIIQNGPSLRFLFTESSGTGYTISEHSARVINGYEDQKKYYDLPHLQWPDGFRTSEIDHFMQSLLAFHDIGKSIAVRIGNKSLQADFNGPYAVTLMKALKFNPAEVKLAHALEQNDDTIGSYLRGIITYDQAQAEFKKWAQYAGMKPEDFFKLQQLYFTADAGSYPDLRSRAFKPGPSGMLESRDFNFKVLSAPYMTAGGPPPKTGIEGENIYGYGPVMRSEDDLVAGGAYIRGLLITPDANSVVGPIHTTGASNLDYDPPLHAILEAGPTLQFAMGLPMNPPRNLEIPETPGMRATTVVTHYESEAKSIPGSDTVELADSTGALVPVKMSTLVGDFEAARSLSTALKNWVGPNPSNSPSERTLLTSILKIQKMPDSAQRLIETVTQTGMFSDFFHKVEDPLASESNQRKAITAFHEEFEHFAIVSGYGTEARTKVLFQLMSAYFFSSQRDGDSMKWNRNYDKLARLMTTGSMDWF